MDTSSIMALALRMAGLEELPGDSAILHPGDGIRRVLIGIDIAAAELHLAHAKGYDAVIAHHPPGGASTLSFHRVLERHVTQMVGTGVPEEVARCAVAPLVETHRVRASMTNYDHVPSVARLLDLPFLNIHTPLDEIGRRRIAEAVAELPSESLRQRLVDHLYERFAEFRAASTRIEVRIGRAEDPMGRVAVSHAAGTNGGYPIAKTYFEHGVDTVVYIHCAPDASDRLAAEAAPEKGLVVTGHIASDSVGITPFVAALREAGLRVDVISGILGL